MKVAIITTGDEIMAGNVTDTNATWMSDHCWRVGAKVVWRFAVADELKEIGEACQLASERADCVLVTGGLGPTMDDITLEAAAQTFHKKMIFHKAVYKDIEGFFKRVGRPLSESNRKQAYLPEGGEPIPNKVGTAPGCQVQLGRATVGRTTFFFLPGVPAELYPMFEDFVLPWLRSSIGGKIVYQEKILKCFGAPEATLDSLLKGVELGEVRLSFRVRFPEIWLKLACWGKDKNSVEQFLAKAKQNFYQRIREYIFGEGEKSLPQVVGEFLMKKQATLALAESCTGGAIADAMTNIPGASNWFERGVVSYSNRSKQELLGVKATTIKKFGAVSEPTAQEMAEGVRKTSGATYALAVTGIAGPSGGTKEKPVGTVLIALAEPKKTEVKHFCFERDRLEFKQIVAATALNWLRQTLL